MNSISPGFTRTEMVEEYPEELIAGWCVNIPMGRLCTIDELKGAAIFFSK